MKNKSHLLISLIIVFCSIIPITFVSWESLYNSRFKKEDIIDLSKYETSNCEYIGSNSFIITGMDAFFIINSLNCNIKNLEISLNSSDVQGIAIYYDIGAGFNEKDSKYDLIKNNKAKFNFKNNVYINNLRVDFENVKQASMNISLFLR